MKVCLVDPYLFTPAYDRALMAGLRSIGQEVRLYARPPSDEEMQGEPDLVQVFEGRSATARGLSKGRKVVAHFRSMRRLAESIEEWRPDVIHFQWLPFPAADRWFLPSLRRIAPLVCTVHDSNPFNGDPTSWVQTIGALEILQRFDAVVVHTDLARRRLEDSRLRIGAVRKIPHGLLHEQVVSRRVRAIRGDSPSSGDILFLGKVKPYKGVDVLIRALALLVAEGTSVCRASLVGKPYMDTRALVSLGESLGIGDLIRYDFRFVPEEEMADLLTRATVVVLPYRQADASGVLMAAVAAGRPVIATRIGGFAELLTDGIEALLVPPDDPPALAQAMARLIRDEGLRQRLAAGMRRLRDATPRWTDIASDTHALYVQVLRAR